MVLSYIIARIFKLERKKEKAFMNAVILRNQGNFGIPLITLLYSTTGNTFPLSIHMIALFTTNLLLNTVGLYNASSGTYTKKEAIVKVLRLPMVYVVLLGFMFKGLHITIPGPIQSTLTIMGNGVVPLALITLGAQLSSVKLKFLDKTLPIAVFMRLIISPLIAFVMTLAFGISGQMAQVLIIGAAAPTAVNSVLLAIEFKGDAEYASETVFLTTLLSAITVTVVIILTRLI
jgi:predicted permease